MKDVVVIQHAEAISGAQELCAQLNDYEVFLFDPALGDPVAATGLRNVQLFTQIAGPTFLSMDTYAHGAAAALEAELDEVQRPRSGASLAGWQHLSFSYLFIAMRWATALWESMGSQLHGRKVHLLVNDNPADYYFNSFVPSLVLATYLEKHGVAFSAYDYGGRGATRHLVPDLRGVAGECGPDHVLTHLPTCIYDSAYFSDEIRAAGRIAINIAAALWDIPFKADRQIAPIDVQEILPTLTPAVRDSISQIGERLRQTLDSLLLPHLKNPLYRARQTNHYVDRYCAQLVTFFELRRHFRDSIPGRLLMSEHDTGFHGPLMSFAADRALPVVLVPHSKSMADLEFAHDDLVALTHPIQGTSIDDGRKRPVATGTLCYPETFSGTSAIGEGMRTVSLLLNSQSLNGVPFTPADAYLDGIKRIVAWCFERGVNLKIRCKPGYTLFGTLRVYVGLDPDTLARTTNETMEEHVRGCDLCLMYDMATSGSISFLRHSLPVLNPIVAELTKQQRSLVHPDLIVPESVDSTLKRLDVFLRDPVEFHRFRTRQFLTYLTLHQQARPLRAYL